MTFARVRLVVAAVLFVGWLSWLGYAVSQRGTVPILSRAQLAGATHLVVADVVDAAAGGDGLPDEKVKVTQILRGDAIGPEIEVTNLGAAQPPGGNGFPGAGQYLLALVPNADGKTYRVAGLPRSPGYEATTPALPVIYPWTDGVRKQLAGLGIP